MLFLYNILIHIAWIILRIISLFNPKIKLFIKGKRNIDISNKLKINQKTVNTYQVRIMKKLEVKSKVELFMMGNSYLKLPY